jgi:F0F1-type ATP synthase membrane subunit b/b'
MEFNAFGFFISIINFGVMFVLFYYVVIGPMEDAVALRQRRVTTRLDEIRQTLTEAQKIESETQAQFAQLEAEKADMRASTEREIARVRASISEQAARDAEHLVAKTRRETERTRQEALALLNRKLADKTMARTQELLAGALDAPAQEASAQGVIGKLVTRAV